MTDKMGGVPPQAMDQHEVTTRYKPVGLPFRIPRSGNAAVADGPRPHADRRIYSSSPNAGRTSHFLVVHWVLPILRVALSLPLVYVAAVGAGIVPYAIGLAGFNSPDEPPELTLGLVAGGAAAVSLLSILAWATLLRERPRHRLWLWSLLLSGTAILVAVAAALLGEVGAVPPLAAAGALLYAAIVAASCGIIGASGLDGGTPVTPSNRRWSGFVWRGLVALVPLSLAVGVAALAFSLFAASAIPAQDEFALGQTLWQRATAAGGFASAGHVAALVMVNSAVGALFGLLVHAALLVLGWWHGRLHRWWLGIAGVTVMLGAVVWILDSSIPRW